MSPVQVNGKPNACINALRKFHFVRQADNNSIDVPVSLEIQAYSISKPRTLLKQKFV